MVLSNGFASGKESHTSTADGYEGGDGTVCSSWPSEGRMTRLTNKILNETDPTIDYR